MVGFGQIILQEFLSGERLTNGLSNFSSISTEEIERHDSNSDGLFSAAAQITETIFSLHVMILFLKYQFLNKNLKKIHLIL